MSKNEYTCKTEYICKNEHTWENECIPETNDNTCKVSTPEKMSTPETDKYTCDLPAINLRVDGAVCVNVAIVCTTLWLQHASCRNSISEPTQNN